MNVKKKEDSSDKELLKNIFFLCLKILLKYLFISLFLIKKKWNTKETQDCRDEFCSKFARTHNNWNQYINEELVKLLTNRKKYEQYS